MIKEVHRLQVVGSRRITPIYRRKNYNVSNFFQADHSIDVVTQLKVEKVIAIGYVRIAH
jgi:hypothetical protein